MFNTKMTALPTIVASLLPTGQRNYSNMISGVRTHAIRVRISGTATLAGGPATAIRNAGSLFALVDAIGIEENGEDRVNIDGRMLRALSQMVSPRSLSATRLSSYANGAYNLSESAIIPFAWPLGVTPVETCFVERAPKQQTRVFAVFNATTGTTALLATTGGTVTISNLQIKLEQIYDDAAIKPLFIPKIRNYSEVIAGANSGQIIYLKSDRWIRALIARSDSTVGEVDDVVNNIALRGDFRDYVGPGLVPWVDLVRGREFEFGGTLTAAGIDATAAAPVQPDRTCYLATNFQEAGRLSNILNPNVDLNLRWVADVQASVTAGATVTRLDTCFYELERVPGITSEGAPFRA